MTRLPVVLALLASAAAGLATMGVALPQMAGDAEVIPVAGCHLDRRTHYVPEAGASVRHYHRSGNCRPVIVDRDRPDDHDWRRGDCHRDVRTHRVDGVRLRHRHVGDDCRIREVRSSGVPG